MPKTKYIVLYLLGFFSCKPIPKTTYPLVGIWHTPTYTPIGEDTLTEFSRFESSITITTSMMFSRACDTIAHSAKIHTSFYHHIGFDTIFFTSKARRIEDFESTDKNLKITWKNKDTFYLSGYLSFIKIKDVLFSRKEPSSSLADPNR